MKKSFIALVAVFITAFCCIFAACGSQDGESGICGDYVLYELKYYDGDDKQIKQAGLGDTVDGVTLQESTITLGIYTDYTAVILLNLEPDEDEYFEPIAVFVGDWLDDNGEIVFIERSFNGKTEHKTTADGDLFTVAMQNEEDITEGNSGFSVLTITFKCTYLNPEKPSQSKPEIPDGISLTEINGNDVLNKNTEMIEKLETAKNAIVNSYYSYEFQFAGMSNLFERQYFGYGIAGGGTNNETAGIFTYDSKLHSFFGSAVKGNNLYIFSEDVSDSTYYREDIDRNDFETSLERLSFYSLGEYHFRLIELEREQPFKSYFETGSQEVDKDWLYNLIGVMSSQGLISQELFNEIDTAIDNKNYTKTITAETKADGNRLYINFKYSLNIKDIIVADVEYVLYIDTDAKVTGNNLSSKMRYTTAIPEYSINKIEENINENLPKINADKQNVLSKLKAGETVELSVSNHSQGAEYRCRTQINSGYPQYYNAEYSNGKIKIDGKQLADFFDSVGNDENHCFLTISIDKEIQVPNRRYTIYSCDITLLST